MRKFTRHLVAALALVSTACIRTATNEATGDVDLDIESPTKVGEDWSGTLAGQGMFTNVSGTTRALVAENKTSLTVTLKNATPGGAYGWDVREGKCGTGGALFGTPSAYVPLIAGSDGTAGKTVQVTGQLDEAKDYAVTIYASPADSKTVVACGDLDD
jgi:hypothetical protein